MKKLSLVLAMLLCLCFAFTALADEKTEDYETIATYYNDAVKALDQEDAEEQLRELIVYYERNEERKNTMNSYLDARLMYYYACGRIAIIDGDYTAAAKYLNDCGNFGDQITDYYAFARGMYLAKGSDETMYPEAIELLRGVQSNSAFTASCLDAIKECETRYRETMLAKAKSACQREDHAAAQNYYTQILDVLPDDAEVKQAYNDCLTHTGSVESAGSIVIKNAYAGSDTSVVLKWEGEKEDYTIWYMADMKNGTDKKQKAASGSKCTVDGLLPNTCYLFRIECDGAWAETTVKTETGSEYSEINSDFTWTGSSTMYCFTKQRDKMLDSGKLSFEYYKDSNVKKSQDRIIPMYDPAVSDSCVLFVFTTLGIPDEMRGKPYQVLLHVEERGTLIGEGLFGDEKLCDNNDRIYLLMYDMLDEANDSYPNLSSVAFGVDVLMEGKIVCSSDGYFEKMPEKKD